MRTTPVTIFYSYARQDHAFRDTLENHLSPLRQQGMIVCWDQSQIGPGVDRQQALAEHLYTARVILLLVSADFLASSDCHLEMQRALQRHQQRSAYVIPLLLRPAAWQETPLAGLQCLPRDGQAMSIGGSAQQDAAFAEIVSALRRVVHYLHQLPAAGPLPPLPEWPPLRRDGPVPAPAQRAMSSTAIKDRLLFKGRAILLRRMQSKINQFKEEKLPARTPLRPGLQEQKPRPLRPTILQGDPTHKLPPLTTSIEEAYERAEDAGGLLLLGAPGAGKTTHLYQLAEHLAAGAWVDEERQVPVLFNLASWGRSRQPLALWLASELHSEYQIPLDIATFWIRHQQILPLLDGLEEVESRSRDACVDAIAAYRKTYGLLPLVLSCRSQDYQALTRPPAFPAHLVIEPLTDTQVASYVSGAGPAWVALARTLQGSVELRLLARTPLFLAMLMAVYRNASPSGDVLSGSLDDRRQRLFTLYIEDRLSKQHALLAFAGERMKYWLSWLARQAYLHQRPVFYIERLQPSWLSNRRMAGIYDLLAVRLPGILIGTLVSIAVAIFFGLLHSSSVADPSTWSEIILPGSLLGWLFSGRALPPRYARRPVRHPTWRCARNWLLVGLLMGALVGVSVWFSDRVSTNPDSGPIDGLINGSVFGVAYFLVPFWLSKRRAPLRAVSGQRRQKFFQRVEVRDGLVVGLLFALCSGIGIFLSIVRGAGLDTPVLIPLTSEFNFQVGTGLTWGLSLSLASALLEGLSFGVVAAILSRLLTTLHPGISPVDRLNWSWGNLGRRLFSRQHLALAGSFFATGVVLIALSNGLSGALVGVADLASQGVWLAALGFIFLAIIGVVGGAIVGIILVAGYALSYWLVVGFLQSVLRETIRDQDRGSPNQGTRRSGGNGLLLGGICGVIAALLGGATNWVGGVLDSLTLAFLNGNAGGNGSTQQLSQLLQKMWNDALQTGWIDARFSAVWIGLSVGLLVALLYGALAFVRHAVIRCQLWRAGLLPGRLQRFLDDAVGCSFLRPSGSAGYEFSHRFLQDYFVSLRDVSSPASPALPGPSAVPSAQAGGPQAPVSPRAPVDEPTRPLPGHTSLPCGHPLREHASFCSICGVSVQPARPQPRSEGSSLARSLLDS
ncbi:MAG TPA: TIR domain-containing protein [Ktedonobacteraceae bacterium]